MIMQKVVFILLLWFHIVRISFSLCFANGFPTRQVDERNYRKSSLMRSRRRQLDDFWASHSSLGSFQLIKTAAGWSEEKHTQIGWRWSWRLKSLSSVFSLLRTRANSTHLSKLLLASETRESLDSSLTRVDVVVIATQPNPPNTRATEKSSLIVCLLILLITSLNGYQTDNTERNKRVETY